jgi:hypothetical protein
MNDDLDLQESPALSQDYNQRKLASTPGSSYEELRKQAGFDDNQDPKPPYIPGVSAEPKLPEGDVLAAPPPEKRDTSKDFLGMKNFFGVPDKEFKQFNDNMSPEQKKNIQDVAASDKNSVARQVVGGVTDVVQQIGNSVLDVVDGVDNWMQSKGYKATDLLPDDHKLDFSEALTPRGDDTLAHAARGLGQFSTHVAAFVAGGSIVQGGKLAMVAGGMATGAAVNFAAFDPHQERLSNLLQDHPQFLGPVSEFLAESKAVNWMAAKPEDGQIEGRLKNAVEGVVQDAALATIFTGIMKGYAVVQQMRGAAKAAGLAGQEAKAVVSDIAPEVKAAGQAQAIGGEVNAGKPNPTAPTEMGIPADGAASGGIQVPPESPAGKMAAEGTALTPDAGAAAVPQAQLAQAGTSNLKFKDVSLDTKAVLANMVAENAPTLESVTRGVVGDEAVKSAALAKLSDKAEITRLLSLPVGSTVNAEERATLIMLENSAGQNLAQKMTEVLANRTPEAEQAYMNAEIMLRQAMGARKATEAEAGRSLRISGVSLGVDDRLVKNFDVLSERLKLSGGRDEFYSNLGKMKDLLAEEPDMVKAFEQIQKKTLTRKLSDALLELNVNSLLSGTTAIKNVASNVFSTAYAFVEKAAAIGVNKVIGDGNASVTELKEFASAFPGGVTDGWRVALKKMENPVAAGVKIPERIPAISGDAFNQSGILGTGLDVLGKAVRLPTTILSKTDELAKVTNYSMQMRAYAYRDAAAKGLEGVERTNHIMEFMKDPPDAVRAVVQNEARTVTFTQELTPWLDNLNKFLKSVPGNVGKFIAPFSNISCGMIDAAVQRNPLLAPFTDKFQAAFSAGGIQREMAIAKVATGATAMTIGGGLAMNGLLTGAGPVNPAARRAWEATGKQPYSIKVGDEWVSFEKLEGVSPLLKMAADIHEIGGYIPEARKDGNMSDLAVASAFLVGHSMTPEVITKSMTDFLEAYDDPKKFKQYLAKTAAGVVPFSGTQRAITRLNDPTKRSTRLEQGASLWDNIVTQVKSTTPGLSKDLPPQRDWLSGDVANYAEGHGPVISNSLAFVGIKTSDEKHDPVANEIYRLGMSTPGYMAVAKPGEEPLQITMPPQSLRVGDLSVPMDPHQYDKFVQLSAGIGLKNAPMPLKQGMDIMIKAFQKNNTPDFDRKVKLRDLVSEYRKAAKEQILTEDRDLARKAGTLYLNREKQKTILGPGEEGNP